MARAIGVQRGYTRSLACGAQCMLFANFVRSVVCSALIVSEWVVLPDEIMYMCDGPIETVECI